MAETIASVLFYLESNAAIQAAFFFTEYAAIINTALAFVVPQDHGRYRSAQYEVAA